MKKNFVLLILLAVAGIGSGCAVWNKPLKPYYGSGGSLHNPYNPGFSPRTGLPYGVELPKYQTGPTVHIHKHF